MEPTYRLVFAHLLDDSTVDALPALIDRFDRRISGVGSLSATIPAPNATLARRVAAVAELEGRCAVYVERTYDGVTDLWWGGIAWLMEPSRQGRDGHSLQVQAATFESYPARRIIRATTQFSQTDQLAIHRALWAQMQSDPAGNIGVQPDASTSGVLRDRTWLASDSKSYADAIAETAEVDGGYEHTIDVYRSGGARVKKMRLGYPKLSGDTVHDFSGSAVLDWRETRDASSSTGSGTAFQARGATPSTSDAAALPLMSAEYRASSLINAGWPLLDVTEDHTSVSRQSTLEAWAQAALATRAGSRRSQSFKVRLVGSTFTPGLLGSTCRFRVRDAWYPNGKVWTGRAVAVEVTPARRGQEESAIITLDGSES